MSDDKKKPRADYEVGYGKPPKATRFPKGKSGNPLGRRKRRDPDAQDLLNLLNEPISVTLNGKSTTVHPHRAKVLAVGHRGVKDKHIGALRAFFKECDRAGLLTPALAALSNIITMPTVAEDVGTRLLFEVGVPPWDERTLARYQAEYDREQDAIDELEKEFLAELRRQKDEQK